MLKNAAEVSNLIDSDGSAVTASAMAEGREPTPWTARRMRDYAMRAGIQASVPRLVPALDAERRIGACRVDIESGN